jgi:hypothetical protein
LGIGIAGSSRIARSTSRSSSYPTRSTAREWRPTASRRRDLHGVDGVWLLPGTPDRDDDAAYDAIRHCLQARTPFLGTCGGFQFACIELARTTATVTAPAHAESDLDGEQLVIVALARSLCGERRLVRPVAGTRLASICGPEPFGGFHFCGYGLAEGYPRSSRQPE